MKQIYKIQELREKVREELVLMMRSYAPLFKEYMSLDTPPAEHNPRYVMIKGVNYGCKDNNYFYFLPNNVQFIYRNSMRISNIIYYNDTIKCWFVYDKDKEESTAFEALDTDSQIDFFAMLDNFLSANDWQFMLR